MTTTQFELLLNMYKKAMAGSLSKQDIDSHILRAKIELDKSFAEAGKEDCSIKQYIEELEELKSFAI